MKQCINIWLVFVLFASYLYSICYCHLPPSLGDVWSEIYLFSNIKRDFFGSVSRISSQLLFCISCPSVMRFAVSGINKRSGGSGNITECSSQGPKLIWARFGDTRGLGCISDVLHCHTDLRGMVLFVYFFVIFVVFVLFYLHMYY